MRLKNFVILAALAVFGFEARATLLSDSFLGLERAALQDALPGYVGDDPFQSVANPAWVPEVSRVALLQTSGLASMNDRAADEAATHVLALALQERKDRWSYGFFAILPTGSQAILDTGDPLERSSPWMNMNRQLLYAMNVSRSFADETWRVGVLVPLSFDANAVARARLEAADVRSRASVSLTPRLSWAVGANWSPPTLYGHTFSLLYKEASESEVQAEIEGNIPLFALDLAFRGESAYGYDPRRLSLNAIKRAALWSFGFRARFSQWSQYSLPFVRVTQSSLEIEDTTPMGQATSTWDLAAGAERWLAPGQALAFSLGWRQSPFKKIESFHDADHYILGAGWTAEFSELWAVSTTLRFHVLDQGVLYTWAGLGLGYRL